MVLLENKQSSFILLLFLKSKLFPPCLVMTAFQLKASFTLSPFKSHRRQSFNYVITCLQLPFYCFFKCFCLHFEWIAPVESKAEPLGQLWTNFTGCCPQDVNWKQDVAVDKESCDAKNLHSYALKKNNQECYTTSRWRWCSSNFQFKFCQRKSDFIYLGWFF